MDVINVEQALIAEAAGACAVMALERVPADIRKNGMLLFFSFHMLCPFCFLFIFFWLRGHGNVIDLI